MSDKVSISHFKFGKLISDEGSVLTGYEHKCTGRCSSFPSEIGSNCHPNAIGLFPGEGFAWRDYRWLDEGGGTICRRVLISTEWWVIVGRVVGLSEQGLNKAGRFYTEAHYAAIPAKKWQPDFLGELNERLKPAPLLREDYNLPPIELDAEQGRQLDGTDWMQRCGELVKLLMSAAPLSIQDWKANLKATLERFQLALALLPRTLAWRIPWGVGLVNMDGKVALAHGMYANEGPRIIGDDKSIRGINELDLNLGEDYVSFLQEILKGVRDLGTIRDAIDRALPDFNQWDSKSPDDDWTKVAKQISLTILEESRLRSFRISPPGTKYNLQEQFQLKRKQALEVALERFEKGDDGLETLASAREPSWEDEWRSCGGFREGLRSSIAQLLGVNPVLKPAELEAVRSRALPPDVQASALNRLSEVLMQSKTLDDWIGLVKGRQSDADWLRAWRVGADTGLTWLAYRDLEGSQRLKDELRAADLDMIDKGLRESSASPSPTLQAVMKAATSVDKVVVSELLGELLPDRRRELCLLLEACSSEAILADLSAAFIRELEGKQGFDDFVKQLAQDVSGSNVAIPRQAAAWLLNNWMFVPEPMRPELSKSLSEVIGQPFARIFFDNTTEIASQEPRRRVYYEAMQQWLRWDQKIWHRLATYLADSLNSEKQAARLLAKWLASADPNSVACDPACRVVASYLSAQPIGDTSTLQIADYRLLKKIGEELQPDLIPKSPLQGLKTSDEIAWVLTRLLPLAGLAASLGPEQLRAVLQDILLPPQSAETWLRIVMERAWQCESKWRLVAFAADPIYRDPLPDFPDLHAEEQQALWSLPIKAKMILTQRAPKVMPAYLCELTTKTISNLSLDKDEIRGLIKLSDEHNWPTVRLDIARYLVHKIRAANPNRTELQALRQALRDSRKWTHKIGKSSPSEYALLLLSLKHEQDIRKLEGMLESWWYNDPFFT